MPNHFALRASWRQVCERFRVERCLLRPGLREALDERLEICPFEPVLIITQEGDAVRSLEAAQWGFVWPDEEALEKGRRRTFLPSERIHRYQVNCHPCGTRRCLIPATAIVVPGAQSHRGVPFVVRPQDHRLFSVAGIWTRWSAPSGASLLTCAMLTTAIPQVLAAPVRSLPLILSPDGESNWLEGGPDRMSDVVDALPCPFDELLIQPVDDSIARHESRSACLPSLLTRLGPGAVEASPGGGYSRCSSGANHPVLRPAGQATMSGRGSR